MMVMAKGLMQTISTNDFDALYNTGSMPMYSGTVNDLSETKKGDLLYFANDSNYHTKHPKGGFTGENIIKVGDDLYWGYPIGNGSYSQWEKKLIEAYNKGLEKNEGITQIPGFNKNVIFFNVSKVGMDVFDLRKSRGK